VGEAVNFRTQMERHRWIVSGAAVAVGCMVGASFGSAEAATEKTASAAPPPPPRSGRTSARESAVSDSEHQGILGDALAHLKNLGVSYVMGIVRDFARNELPEAVASRVADEVDALTSKLGTTPIPGPVLPAKKATENEGDQDFAPSTGSPERKASNYRGRTPSMATVY